MILAISVSVYLLIFFLFGMVYLFGTKWVRTYDTNKENFPKSESILIYLIRKNNYKFIVVVYFIQKEPYN